jgi:hypothetical protein
MRHSMLGALLVAGLMIAATAGRTSSEPVGVPADFQNSARGELIAYRTAADGQPQVVTVIDPRQRAMAVYDVDRKSGEITLKSVRNITWDLQMPHYNSGDPLPQDIREGLQR